MATKSKKSNAKTPSSRTRQSQKSSFKFRWWMAVILVGIITIIGIVVVRFGNASTRDEAAITPGPTYWLGDSLSVGLAFGGELGTKLKNKGFDPITINADPGRSIRGKGLGTKQSGLEAIDVDQAKVKAAKLIVIFLGTNPEDDFAGAQAELLNKIHAINPTAQVLWVDLAAVGDAKSTRAINNKTKRAEENKAIYANSSVFAMQYGVLSQFNFIWGNKALPSSLASQNLPDPGQLLEADGVHYAKAGYLRLADYFVSSLLTGNISLPGTLSTGPSETSLSLPTTNANYTLSQPKQSSSSCATQTGFKSNTNFRACIITADTPLTISSNFLAQYTNTNKLKICVSAINGSQQPIQVNLSNNNTLKTTMSLTPGTDGLSRLLACGTTTTPPGAFNSMTITTPARILASQLSIKAL